MQEKLLDLIANIHDAAIDPARWDSVMQEVAALLGGHAISLQRLDIRSNSMSIEAASGIDPDRAQLYAEHYAASDPWLNIVAPHVEQGKVAIGAEFVPITEMSRTDVFNDIYQPLDIFDFVSLMIEKNEREWRFLSVNYSKSKETFTSEDKELLSVLFPHLRSAVAVRDKILAVTSQIQSREAALHNLAAPILLLARNGRVLFSNAAAEALLTSASPFALFHGELQLADSAARNILSSALANPLTVRSFTLVRGDGFPPWIVHLTPVSSDAARQFLPQGDDAVLLLSISDPLKDIDSRIDQLISAFGFTQSEAQVAHHLAAERSVEDTALAIGRSRETVRTHVKSLLSKTGTRRQAELISLLLRGLSPFGHNTG